ncbi:DUF4303 domain-containing protein [Nocardiopsis dassonvillei]|uniref:DUF4303 domain-containing protein n=2 Tax=Nocardiopsidaceae TaxID=83676 RepID=D7B5D4_NOCDD|nr:hypothetical protein Ndas_1773 [Nocardiopsis dassonvillei subsp. dassonvillei DSM 43111]APC35434.1 DUF4303 domain-containing protein [Nocardiopsis dassonvillei]NKY78851.1 DUF4303 domain-containing protein [Nocardiopsis dassonvillei]VEI87234.1 Uncharacterised protein [Nocardiopsis dassonvillei]
MDMDWDGFEADLTTELEGFARSCLARGGRVYAVAVYLFYAETCGRIMLPVFAAATEEWFEEHLAADRRQREHPPSPERDLRWDPADWPHQHFDADWSDPGAFWTWSRALTEAASGDGAWDGGPEEGEECDEEHWERVHDRYTDVVARACRGVAATLRRERTAPDGLVVVALDEGEELVPRTLTAPEIRRHFPHLDADHS